MSEVENEIPLKQLSDMPKRKQNSNPGVVQIFTPLVSRLWHSATLMTWISMSTRIGGLAILVPIVLTRLSAPEVLIWQMIASITILITLADFGFNPTFARIIAFARGGGTMGQLVAGGRGGAGLPSDDRSESALSIYGVLIAQATVYRRLILIAAIISAVGGTLALWRPIAMMEHSIDGWVAWICAAAAGLLILANGANVAVLTGFDRIALARRLDAIVSVLQLASTSVVALAGFGLVGIVLCYSLWMIPLFVLNHRYGRAAAMTVPRAEQAPDPRLTGEIWRSAWRSGVGIIASTGIIQASGLVYAQIASVADAAAYLLLLRAVTVAAQLSQAPFYSRLPRMAQLRAEGRIGEVADLARRGMGLAFWTYVVTALGLLLVAPPALRLIGSSVSFPDAAVSFVLVAAFFVERYCAMHIQIYSLTHHIIWHIMNGVTGGLMITFGLMLLPLVGQLALPLAILLGYMAFFAWYGSSLSLRSLSAVRWGFELRTSVAPGLLLLACFVASGVPVVW